MIISVIAFITVFTIIVLVHELGHFMAARRSGVKVYGMISLEMLGFFCDQKGCQTYPFPFLKWFYPDKGNFIAFVGNISSKSFTKKVRNLFRSVSFLPVESLNTVSIVLGVDFSDHRSFWRFGCPAFMITDTASYRNPNYHGYSDTASTLDHEKMAELVIGLYKALRNIDEEKNKLWI